MNPFKTLRIPEARRYCIRQARVPTCFLPDGPTTTLDRDGATLADLVVDNDKIAAIEPAGGAAYAGLLAIDLGSRHVWPTLIDMHAHLDKGHIVNRTEISARFSADSGGWRRPERLRSGSCACSWRGRMQDAP